MSDSERICRLEDIEFRVVYSGRRTIGISVLPDSSVVVRVPYRTSLKTASRIVSEKYDWILKHRDKFRNSDNVLKTKSYTNGENHLFRGRTSTLRIERSEKPYVRFFDSLIAVGTRNTDDPEEIRKLLYKGYKYEAMVLFPELMNRALKELENHKFRPNILIIRTMKRRWGSCSAKGVITLSTELIKLDDMYTEYVIRHELCHLKHHNHGPKFYKLLSEVCPEWKDARKKMRSYIQ